MHFFQLSISSLMLHNTQTFVVIVHCGICDITLELTLKRFGVMQVAGIAVTWLSAIIYNYAQFMLDSPVTINHQSNPYVQCHGPGRQMGLHPCKYGYTHR